ncbi:MAG: type I restriction enzyme HsdR N-terminal domain-containing protein [Rikenellaceae bacterium]
MQLPHPKLNFPPINLRVKGSGTTIQVWDPLRRSYIVLTPEEWVRRHVVGFLLSELSIPAAQIVQEYPVVVNAQNQRADVVVLSRQGKPLLMVECKAYDVKLSQSTLDQAVRYNSVLSARYIMLTNGVSHHIYECVDSQGYYRPLKTFSDLEL